MGLDITAYKQLTKLDVLFNEDGEPVNPDTREPIDAYVKVWENPDFPGRAEGLQSGAAYSYTDAMDGGRMGYGRYNGWRETLARVAGYPAQEVERYGSKEKRHDAGVWSAPSGPFWELINFSDCEGTIGPVIAAKLAKDFAAHDARAKEAGDDHFYDAYQLMREAFEFAADNGAVLFH